MTRRVVAAIIVAAVAIAGLIVVPGRLTTSGQTLLNPVHGSGQDPDRASAAP